MAGAARKPRFPPRSGPGNRTSRTRNRGGAERSRRPGHPAAPPAGPPPAPPLAPTPRRAGPLGIAGPPRRTPLRCPRPGAAVGRAFRPCAPRRAPDRSADDAARPAGRASASPAPPRARTAPAAVTSERRPRSAHACPFCSRPPRGRRNRLARAGHPAGRSGPIRRSARSGSRPCAPPRAARWPDPARSRTPPPCPWPSSGTGKTAGSRQSPPRSNRVQAAPRRRTRSAPGQAGATTRPAHCARSRRGCCAPTAHPCPAAAGPGTSSGTGADNPARLSASSACTHTDAAACLRSRAAAPFYPGLTGKPLRPITGQIPRRNCRHLRDPRCAGARRATARRRALRS